MILHTPFFFSGYNMLKIGDFITGTREADEHYFITNKNMTLAIVSYVYDCRLDDDDIEYVDIVVLKHRDLTYVGRTYKVMSHLFDNVSNSHKPTKNELTIQKLLLNYRCDVPGQNVYHKPITEIILSENMYKFIVYNRDFPQKYKNFIYKIRKPTSL